MNGNFNKNNIKYLSIINRFLKLFVKEKKASKNIDILKINNVIILGFNLIGDDVMTIPMYRTIRYNNPYIRITVVGNSLLKKQLVKQNLVDSFIEFDGIKILSNPVSWIKNIKLIIRTIVEVNYINYDLAIEPRGDIRYIFFMHFIKSTHKLSYDVMSAEYMLTDSVEYDKSPDHEIDRRLYLLESAGFLSTNDLRRPILKTTDEQKENNKAFLKSNQLYGKTIIGIHPGASKRIKQFREYPKMISEVIERLPNKEKYSFLVFCGPKEEEIAAEVNESISKEGMPTILCNDNLDTYIGRIALCDYMICNDSGAGHLAAAYGIPTTVFFGPVDDKAFSPRGAASVYIVAQDVPCKPCHLPYCELGTEECIKSITVDEGAEMVMRMLLESRKEDN
ncbi:MAG: glycosyltransferase family 9 protein [Clostridiales bacterium]|nr:glycosyltransferase family 9 protein [Clostridiales bacterium]